MWSRVHGVGSMVSARFRVYGAVGVEGLEGLGCISVEGFSR